MLCVSEVKVTGSPPDLQLVMTLRNVTQQDDGEWRLTVANDRTPADTVNFFLSVLAREYQLQCALM